MSNPLFIGSYLQVTWWDLGQWKGRKKMHRMIIKFIVALLMDRKLFVKVFWDNKLFVSMILADRSTRWLKTSAYTRHNFHRTCNSEIYRLDAAITMAMTMTMTMTMTTMTIVITIPVTITIMIMIIIILYLYRAISIAI